ncbi:Protein kinase-like domain protein [Cordyceps fumosorosea ARSEF 2679]|uniref:Protein kinase-like domain protein n=1 Tax=Cordyceps fumosorosea (strain ARSEF 2679) TaxID=1081104 RepID=A0A168CAD0_CORFA|nr:Protein kinase-like domain protein [Cordyceps fumosorosea ARSEF 2679]OAA71148.1 Protein kinase-like domain protein [Cordyceps fumosorosea ARSEF 2679]
MVESGTFESSEKQLPVLSLRDLTILEAFDQGATEAKYVTFYHVTSEDELYFGHLFKRKKEITLEEYNAALEHIPDSEIYPEVPRDTPINNRARRLGRRLCFHQAAGSKLL